MTHACCRGCRLRVVTAPTTGAPPCPGCGHPMVVTTAREGVGCRLVMRPDPSMAAVAAAAMPVPEEPC